MDCSKKDVARHWPYWNIEQEEKLTGRKWLLEKVDQKILK